MEPRDQPEAIHPGPLSTLVIGEFNPALSRNPKRSAPRPPPPPASLRIFSSVWTSIRIIAAQNAALGAIFDPNSACVQRQHARDRARGIGGPGGLAWAIGAGRGGQGELLELGGAELPKAEVAKPAKLQTQGRKRRQIRRLCRAFQHRPSNTPGQALRQRQKTAIPAAPGSQLLDPAELALADAGRAAQARDRAPKLSPRIPTRTLRIAISGP